MKNCSGGADADFPPGRPGQKPGYRAYIESLDIRRETPAALILAAGEQVVSRIVRSCGAVLGPVHHLADTDHAAIRAAVARLEEGGTVLAVTGSGIWMTGAGGVCRCPLCGAFGPGDASGWRDGACPVIAGPPPASADQLTGPVLAALHVLLDDVREAGSESATGMASGYSINLLAPVQGGSEAAQLAGVCIHGR